MRAFYCNKLKIRLLVFLFLITSSFSAFSQQLSNFPFEKFSLETDSGIFSLNQNTVNVKGETHLLFNYSVEDEVFVLKFQPNNDYSGKLFKLAESADYQTIDSLQRNADGSYYFKGRFQNLSKSNFLSIRILIKSDSAFVPFAQIPLQPYTQTKVELLSASDELFVGEEKTFELLSNNVANLRFSGEWVRGEDIDYRLSSENGRIYVHVQAKALGHKTLNLKALTNKPALELPNKLIFETPIVSIPFTVKTNRLAFLSIDQNEITYDRDDMNGIEIQINSSRSLVVGKTYRIEAQEERGGALIGELYTRNSLANDKVLCILRPYHFHRMSEGYLYIKDGDDARFVTNFNITPKANIKKISILRNGGEWTENMNVYPGETIHLRIEGESLHKAYFQFEGLQEVKPDSVVRSENAVAFTIHIPLDITRRKIEIYNRNEKTAWALNLKEYQTPRNFDFVYLNWGEPSKRVSGIRGIETYPHTIRDVMISFANDKIDDAEQIYGIQYLDVEIKVFSPKGEMIDYKTIENLKIVPGMSSPRSKMYDRNSATLDDISLNRYLSSKTHQLAPWSKISITFKHSKDKYNVSGMSKTIDIMPSRYTTFDIDVSFPAGLLIKKQGDTDFGNFSGLSMAMIAQFSFYDKDKIATYKPYKIGVGCIALNAFNFSQDTQRDLGVVVIGSIYPTRKDSKLSFPLYLGGGYLLSQKKMFWLLGPGIRVSF
jgi:hypothetical protein